MPYARPTLSELRLQTAADINAALPGVDALLPYSNLGILSDVLAALTHGHYGYLDWIALNQVPFTATGEFLEGWAGLKGITRKPAASAIGTATFTATTGTMIPAGTPLNRADGIGYFTSADAKSVAGVATVPVQALVGGVDGNANIGTTLTLATGISGVALSGAATSPLAGGADVETDADLRSRMLAAYANPPQGGSITDYPSWALAVPGVTRCWVNPGAMGPGSLVLLFMMDDAQAANGGFPQGTNGCSTYETRDTAATGDQLAVADAIFPKQSVTALVYAVAPTPNAIGLTIAGIASASSGTKSAIAAAVVSALLVDAVPGGTTNLSAIEAAIAAVDGAAGFVLTGLTASAGTVSNGSTGNIRSNTGALPVLSSIAYV